MGLGGWLKRVPSDAHPAKIVHVYVPDEVSDVCVRLRLHVNGCAFAHERACKLQYCRTSSRCCVYRLERVGRRFDLSHSAQQKQTNMRMLLLLMQRGKGEQIVQMWRGWRWLAPEWKGCAWERDAVQLTLGLREDEESRWRVRKRNVNTHNTASCRRLLW